MTITIYFYIISIKNFEYLRFYKVILSIFSFDKNKKFLKNLKYNKI